MDDGVEDFVKVVNEKRLERLSTLFLASRYSMNA